MKKKILLFLVVPLFAAGLFLRVQTAGLPVVFQYDPYFELAEDTYAHYAALFGAPGALKRLFTDPGSFSYARFRDAGPGGLKWHAPGHQLVCAALYSLTSDHLSAVKLFSLLCNLLTICLLFLLLRHFFGADHGPVLLGLNLLLFLPAHIYFSNFASNDVSFSALCALFLLVSFRTELGDKSFGGAALLGFLCALLMLVKYTGLACFVYLNALLLLCFFKKKYSFARYTQYSLLVWGITAALCGWLYVPLLTSPSGSLSPWMLGANEHNFFSFKFFSLLAGLKNDWHESESVLTGLFASFLSFDRVNALVQARELRNAVFWLALLPLGLILAGIASSLRNRRYDALNLFSLIAAAGTARMIWEMALPHGMLKSAYVMFCAPAGAVYFAEGCRAAAAWRKGALWFCALYAVLLDLLLIVYYYRVDFSGW